VPRGSPTRILERRAFIISNNQHISIKGSYVGENINNSGEISVLLWDENGQRKWRPYEELTLIDGAIHVALPEGKLELHDMNSEGRLVGTVNSPDWNSVQPFTYYQGNLVIFEPVSPWSKTSALPIHDYGDFVGRAYVVASSDCKMGYVYRNGKHHDLGRFPGKLFSAPLRYQ
jgi:hypothetical protein